MKKLFTINHQLSAGFTLIELLVVISIIGILAALALTSYSGAQKQSRDTERRSDLNQYRNALESYAASNNGLYPVKASADNVSAFCDGGDLTEFMSSCPIDSDPEQSYSYISNSGGTVYKLYATLETGGYWIVCSTGKAGKVDDVAASSTCEL